MDGFDFRWTDICARLKRFVRSRVEDDPTADDLLQEIFIRIHQNIGSLHNSDRLESWIYQIARRVIIDHYRARRRQTALSETLPDHTPYFQEPDAVEELSESIRQLVEALPEPYREALLLTEFEGLNQRDLAKRLGISLSGAKSRVQRARQKIKDELMACCHFEFDRYGRVIDFREHCCRCAREKTC